MKNCYLLILSFFLAQRINSQGPGEFFFTIASPSSIYMSLGPDEFGISDGGWGWDGTIPNDFFAEIVTPSDAIPAGINLCEPNSEDFSGKVVLVDRGLCDFSEKAWIAEHQGAIALVIHNFEDHLLHMYPCLQKAYSNHFHQRN